MIPVAVLESRTGTRTAIAFDPGKLEPLAREGRVDAYIVACEDGFSPLGMNRRFLSRDLGIPEEEISDLASWNRFENPRVTLVALAARRRDSILRGVILAASETSECYKRLATPMYGQPHRDFYYNVTHEGIAYASAQWGARRPAISHLSASGHFHEDIATCNGEALAHYCDENADTIDVFSFVGCCISAEHLAGIERLNTEARTGGHRAITTEVEKRAGHALVHLNWNRDV